MRHYAMPLSLVIVLATALSGRADVLANWTFETSRPTGPGPHLAEVGVFSGSSFASTNSNGAIFNPVGNGSNESFGSNNWGDSKYYQFTTPTTGYKDITISYAQAASDIWGPANFQFQYSLDGVAYSDFGVPYAGPTGNFSSDTFRPGNVQSVDLSTIPGLNDQGNVGFRVAVSGDSAEGGGVIGVSGTFRVDNFIVNAVPDVFQQGVCGQTCTGSVTLTEDIGPCPGNGIIIGANGVTLDGNGYQVIGSGAGIGVALGNGDNVTVENLDIRDFGAAVYASGGHDNTIYRNRISNNGSGVLLDASVNNSIHTNLISENTGGLEFLDGSLGNSVYHNLLINNTRQIFHHGDNTWIDPVHGLGNFWGNYWGLDDGSDGRVAGDYVGDTLLPHEGVDPAPLLDPSIPMALAASGGPLEGNGTYIPSDPNGIPVEPFWKINFRWILWRGGWSPVEVQARNPAGDVISATENDIGADAFYMEDNDVVPGSKQVRVMIFNPAGDVNALGDYTLEMTALDDLTYWMEHFVSGEAGVQFAYSVPDGVMANGETQEVETRLEPGGVELVVPLDLQPASDENLVNADESGIVSVAILTTPTFDASTVDPETVSLDGVGVAFGTGTSPIASIEDIDGDGDFDLMLQMDYTSPTPGDGLVILSGMTFDAIPLAANNIISVIFPGNYNGDDNVDGADFLKWQQGESPNPFSQSDLNDWETNYGTPVPPPADSGVVPEPASVVLVLLGAASMCLPLRRRLGQVSTTR